MFPLKYTRLQAQLLTASREEKEGIDDHSVELALNMLVRPSYGPRGC